MKDGGLPTRTGLEHPEDESNHPGIEGAPVRCDGVCEVTAKVSAGDIQIRVPIPADRETKRQRLQKPRRNRGGPHRGSDKPDTSHRFSRFNRDFRFDLPDKRTDPEFPFLISKTERWHTFSHVRRYDQSGFPETSASLKRKRNSRCFSGELAAFSNNTSL